MKKELKSVVIVVIFIFLGVFLKTSFESSNYKGLDSASDSSVFNGINGFTSDYSYNVNSDYIYKEQSDYIEISVKDYSDTVNSIVNLVEKYEGSIDNESLKDNDYDLFYRYNLSIKVPVDKYTEFIKAIEKLGSIKSKSSYISNVTEKVLSIESKIELYESRISRYESLLKSDDLMTSDILEIENALTEIEYELECLKEQIKDSKIDTSYVSVDIRLLESKSVFKYVMNDIFEDTVDSVSSVLRLTIVGVLLVPLSFLGTFLFSLLVKFKRFLFSKLVDKVN